MEKVIQEFKIVETDDGFRIEIKGDKEKMRAFVEQMDPRNWGSGPWFWSRRRHQRGFGPWGFTFGRAPFGPPWTWWACEDDDTEQNEEEKV